MALDFLFPQKCLGCGEEGEILCRSCRKLLPRIVHPVCPQCGRPQASGLICPVCVTLPAVIDGVRSPLKFEGVVREAIHQFKYKNLRTLAKPLAEILQEYLTRYPLPVQILVPVPLHAKRLKERGYNQSELLAHEIGKLIPIPVIADCLVRTKYLLPQARTASVEERRQNVKGAFSLQDSRLSGKQVLLIDDVATSGSTLESCASVIKYSGAASVWGLVLARDIIKV